MSVEAQEVVSQEGQKKKGLFAGPYGRFLLPGVILQSVLIGGGYATGREVVQFGARFGAFGWVAGLAIFVGFGVMAFLMFEVSRRFQAFDYRSLLQKLIGPLYWLFDIVYILLAILIISIMASANGEILNSTLGFNYWVGVVLIVAAVGLLNFFGEGVIERFKSIGMVFLYVGYVLFATLVITQNWDQILSNMGSGSRSLYPSTSMWAIAWSGIIYVGYNLAVYPSALFTVRRQTRLRETVVAGLVAGLMMTIPWFLTYFSLMGFYPEGEIFDAPVPWLQMLGGYGVWIVVIFGIVVGWTLIATATGMIYALIARVDQSLVDADRSPMGRKASGAIAVLTLIIALILSQVGIIDLISKGYTALGYAMIAVFAIPLLVRGTYLIVTRQGASFSDPNDPNFSDPTDPQSK